MELREIADAFSGGGSAGSDLRFRKGVVTAVGTGKATIKIGGDTDTIPDVPVLNSYNPAVNDVVTILQNGPSLLIIGKVGLPDFLAKTGKAADADKLDGLDSTAFVRQGRVTTTKAGENTAYVTSLNQDLTTGVYNGVNMTGAPTTDWYLVHVMSHHEPGYGTDYQRQVAYKMTGGVGGASGNPQVFTRSTDGGVPTLAASWTPWRRLDEPTFDRGGVYANADQTFPAQVGTDVLWNMGAGYYDSVPSSWANASDKTRLQVPATARPGFYVAEAHLMYNAATNIEIGQFLGAYDSAGNHKGWMAIQTFTSSDGTSVDASLLWQVVRSKPTYMIPGEFFRLQVRPGSTVYTSGGYHINPHFIAYRVGG